MFFWVNLGAQRDRRVHSALRAFTGAGLGFVVLIRGRMRSFVRS